jgi:diguanylate cyclase (GGDEF)-like protein
MRDVTRLRELEAESRRVGERLAHEWRVLDATLSSVRDGVALASAQLTLVYANPAYFALTGLRPGAPLGIWDIAPHLAARSDHPEEVIAFFANAAERDAVNVPRVFELARPERVVLERRVTAAAEVGELVIVWRDITAQYDLERERTRLAHTDPLTQLLNRRGLEALLPRERARAHRTGARLAVVVLDIDRFKELNDTRGHIVGDRVLVAVAKAIVATCRATDLVARWGGEEFVVWVDGADGAAIVAERVRRTIAETFPEGMAVTVSAGVAALAHPDEPLEDALERADARLYEAKRRGRDRVVGDPEREA